jgi:hypothetical protein
MSGKNTGLDTLELRKRLLVAESELNRLHLVGETGALMESVYTLTDQAKSYSAIGSAVAILIAGGMSMRRRKKIADATRQSWLNVSLKGAGLLLNLWLASRAKSQVDE